MKRRWIALALVLALLAGMLSGCGKKKTGERFYTLAEQVRTLRDVQVAMTVPFHGAAVQVEGFVSCTGRQAELTFTLKGAQEQDAVWTQLRVIGNDIWLNVGQLAQTACAFPLTEERAADIRELAAAQSAPWLRYTWEGDFWQDVDELWQGWFDGLAATQDTFGDYVQSVSGGAALKLERGALEQAGVDVDELVQQHREAMGSSLVDTVTAQVNLSFAIPESVRGLFDKLWNGFFGQPPLTEDEVVDLDQVQVYGGEDGEAQPETAEETAQEEPELQELSLTLTGSDEAHTVSLTRNEQAVCTLTLTPDGQGSVQPPEQDMGFEAYYTNIYYLISLSRTYIADVLDGTQPEESHQHTVLDSEEETVEPIQPLAVFPVPGAADLVQINYLDENGGLQQVPILSGYTENMVTSVEGDGEIVTQLTLYAEAWTQEVYTLEAEQQLADDLQEEIDEYQDVYILASGGQLLEWPGQPILSEDGTCGALGFSYQENPMAGASGKIVVLLRQRNAKAYTVLDFSLLLDELTDTQREQLTALFDSLGVEVPIQLELQ